MDTITKGKKVACPASAEFLDPLAAGFKLHFATPAELQKHGGVCKACSEKFAKAHKTVVSGKRIETPVDLNEHHLEPDLAQDHVAFDAPGDLVGIVDFPFAEIDGVLESAPEDARQLAGEVLREIFHFCFGTGHKQFGETQLKTAAMRLAIVVSGLRPEIVNNATHGELAKCLSRTKAAASKSNVLFQSRHGFKFARSRDESARAKMRARRLGGPDRHHHDTEGVPS